MKKITLVLAVTAITAYLGYRLVRILFIQLVNNIADALGFGK